MSYPQGPGQPGENPYPPYPGGPAQPGAGEYQQPQYPQPQYPPMPAYPPQYMPQHGQQPNPAQYSAPAAFKESNSYASQALLWGGISLVIAIAGFILGFYYIGVLGLYAIYLAIRGLITAFGLRTHAGLISSIFGLFFSLLSLLVTLLTAGAFNSFLIPHLGG